MSTAREPSPYTSYILRTWQEGSTWRYSLEEVGGGKRHGFASLDELVAFLLARAVLPSSADEKPPRTAENSVSVNQHV